jgi:hypothetical protein
MYFAHLARIAAVLVLLLGVGQVVMGFSLAGPWSRGEIDLSRYTAAATTGELIDRGMRKILIALALGTLAEIAFAIRNNRGQ